MNDRIRRTQRDRVLVDVKAKPSGWPTASLDPDSGRGPWATSGTPAPKRSTIFALADRSEDRHPQALRLAHGAVKQDLREHARREISLRHGEPVGTAAAKPSASPAKDIAAQLPGWPVTGIRLWRPARSASARGRIQATLEKSRRTALSIRERPSVKGQVRMTPAIRASAAPTLTAVPPPKLNPQRTMRSGSTPDRIGRTPSPNGSPRPARQCGIAGAARQGCRRHSGGRRRARAGRQPRTPTRSAQARRGGSTRSRAP